MTGSEFQDDVGWGVIIPNDWSINYIKNDIFCISVPDLPTLTIDDISIVFVKEKSLDYSYKLSFSYCFDSDDMSIHNHSLLIHTNHKLEYPVGHDECIVKWIVPAIKKLHGD